MHATPAVHRLSYVDRPGSQPSSGDPPEPGPDTAAPMQRQDTCGVPRHYHASPVLEPDSRPVLAR